MSKSLACCPFLSMINWTTFARRSSPIYQKVAYLSSRGMPLLRFPSRLVYVVSCRCWTLREYVDLNPGGKNIKGTLNYHDGWHMTSSEFTEIGEAFAANDGLIHPENACKDCRLQLEYNRCYADPGSQLAS